MIRIFLSMIVVTCLLASPLLAQREGGPGGRGGRGPGGPVGPGGPAGPGRDGGNVQESVERLMNFDKNSDGKLSTVELSDTRLASVFQRADANNDQVVTREELTSLLTRESQGRQFEGRQFEGRRGDGPRDDGRPGEGMRGPGGLERGGNRGEFGGEFGGRGDFARGRGPMMRPGQIMPDFLLEQLHVNEEQKTALAKLQAHVDSELAKILTVSQHETMQQFAQGPRGDRGPFEGREGAGEFRREGREGRGPGEGGRGSGDERGRGEGRGGDRPRAEGRP